MIGRFTGIGIAAAAAVAVGLGRGAGFLEICGRIWNWGFNAATTAGEVSCLDAARPTVSFLGRTACSGLTLLAVSVISLVELLLLLFCCCDCVMTFSNEEVRGPDEGCCFSMTAYIRTDRYYVG